MRLKKSQLVECGVDYLTVTCMKGKSGARMMRVAKRIMQGEMQAGSQLGTWRGMAYQGYKCGDMEVGEREDGVCIRLAGALADKWYRDLIPLAHNVTRIDLQATFAVGEEASNHIDRVKKRAYRFSRTHPKAAEAWERGSSRQSSTLYVGARTSTVFLRVYDRGNKTKSKDDEGKVRYEGEFKEEAAAQVAEEMMRAVRPLVTAYDRISHTFKSRGIILPRGDSEPQELRCPRRRADVRKTLGWLTKSVAPSLMSLIRRQLLSEALEALGISDIVQPIAQQPSRVERDVNRRKSHGREVESLSPPGVVYDADNEPSSLPQRRGSRQRGGSSSRDSGQLASALPRDTNISDDTHRHRRV